MRKYLLVFVFLMVGSAHGATIHGRLYDVSLTNLKNAVVEIDTQPAQRYVAVNGSYSFNVPLGSYSISAIHDNARAKENISVEEEGVYVLDLFLYPDLEDPELAEIDFVPYETSKFPWPALLAIAILPAAVVFFVLRKRPDIPDLDEDSRKVLSLLRKNGGRMTQKKLRNNFSISEAKVSLMLTELEDRNLIKKIRKGRGNVIVLYEKFK